MIMEQLLLLGQFEPDFGGAQNFENNVAIDGTFLAVLLVVWLAFVVLCMAGLWATFTKAGKPGWAAIIPIYNIFVLVEISGRPSWWIILFFLPIISLIAVIIITLDVATKFGRGAGFGLGLVFLPFIFYPILGFSDAEYSP